MPCSVTPFEIDLKWEIFKSSIGSTNGTTSHFLVNNDTKATEPCTNNDFLVNSKDMLDELSADSTKGNVYLDDIMVSAAHTSRPKGISASHFSKICRIDLYSAKQTRGHVPAQHEEQQP